MLLCCTLRALFGLCLLQSTAGAPHVVVGVGACCAFGPQVVALARKPGLRGTFVVWLKVRMCDCAVATVCPLSERGSLGQGQQPVAQAWGLWNAKKQVYRILCCCCCGAWEAVSRGLLLVGGVGREVLVSGCHGARCGPHRLCRLIVLVPALAMNCAPSTRCAGCLMPLTAWWEYIVAGWSPRALHLGVSPQCRQQTADAYLTSFFPGSLGCRLLIA